MPTSTVEDYLKAILLQEEPMGSGSLVPMGQIGVALEVTPGTVTSMVKTLEKDGLLRYEPYNGVRLTDDGRQAALEVLRRHRLIELFLVEVLHLNWSEVHEEAERLEHALSAKLVDRIDALLGYPTVDPHGDPIPDGQGALQRRQLHHLNECRTGVRCVIARVSDQDQAFLQFVERHGLKPGTEVIVERDPIAAAVTIHLVSKDASAEGDAGVGAGSVTIGMDAAAKLWVEDTLWNADNNEDQDA